MRSVLALAASALAGLAAVIASLDSDADIVPFFVGLTFLGGVGAWAAHPPFEGSRRWIARGTTLLWLIAAVWVAVLLTLSVTVWQASSPPPRRKTPISA
jgi:peptidoglycan/LPS O-acetylase OafA/YrhL